MSSETISIIPIQTLPAEEYQQLNHLLHVKAGHCLSRKLSNDEYFMRICSYGQPGREQASHATVSIKFDAEKFGFGLNDLALLPDKTYGLCVGISDLDSEQLKVWFISQLSPGIFYYPGANSPESFVVQGFAKVSSAG
jgi:hypothetical protein